jgi:hypothetical protein
MAQFVRHGPGRLIRHTECAVKHRSGGRRFLRVAGRTFAGDGRIDVLPAATGAELGPFLKPISPPIRIS